MNFARVALQKPQRKKNAEKVTKNHCKICVFQKLVVTLHAFSGVLCLCGSDYHQAIILLTVELGSGSVLIAASNYRGELNKNRA